MVDRGAHDGQAERHIHAGAEARKLEHRQALVVIHGEHAIDVGEQARLEQGVGRVRAARFDAERADAFERRGDEVAFLGTQMPAFARMRVEAGDGDARLGDAEFGAQIVLDDDQRLNQAIDAQGIGHGAQRQMGGGERHAQHARGDRGARGQHHDHALDAATRCQVFGMAGEGRSGIVDDALVHRRGHDRGVAAGACAVDGFVEHGEHMRGIAHIEPAGHDRRLDHDVMDGHALRAEHLARAHAMRGAFEHRARTDHDEFVRIGALGNPLRERRRGDLGPDAGRLTGGDRNGRFHARACAAQFAAASRRSST